MFDEIEKRLAHKPRTRLGFAMKECLPQIYNALYPSSLSIATNTENQLISVREDIQNAMDVEEIGTNTAYIQEILNKIQSITDRANKLVHKQKKG
jgi:hypothetical protein